MANDDQYYAHSLRRSERGVRRERGRDWVDGHRLSRRLRGLECEACGFGKYIEAHHIDNDPSNSDPDNIQTLCRYCHRFWHDLTRRLSIHPAGRCPEMIKQAKNR